MIVVKSSYQINLCTLTLFKSFCYPFDISKILVNTLFIYLKCKIHYFLFKSVIYYYEYICYIFLDLSGQFQIRKKNRNLN